MRLRSKATFILSLAIVPLIALAIVLTPHTVSAEAGSGGGGGANGCSQYNYSTCFGAVWRYYNSTSNSYAIKNVGTGYTFVTNCGSTGGFFAYVLVHKNYPNDPSQVRSWKIGPVDGDPGNRSEFFGGWTRYRIKSNPSDGIPTNPSSGDYSWYSVEKAFAQTKSLGQNSGYQWNSSSTLGWFCYKGLDFDLTPQITGSPATSEGGQNITLNPTVDNAGPTGSAPVTWRVTSLTLNPNDPLPTAATNTTAPETYYAKPGNNIRVEINSSQSFASVGVNVIPARNVVLGDYAVGTRVCYILSLSPYSHLVTNGWRHSSPFCVTVAKQPKVQILGSDLVVGKGTTSTIVAPATRKTVSGTARTYGSWGEYGVIASGLITGFASGGGYSGGNTNAPYCSASYLTFTNAGTSTCVATASTKGGYAMPKSLPDISGRFVAKLPITGGTVNVSTAGAGVYGVDSNTSPTITVTSNAIPGGEIAKGKSIIINAPTATVNITRNIQYTGATLNRASDIPQLVIIANNINIAGSVTRIDAWLIATGAAGNLNTCSGITNPSAQLNSTVCNSALRVNGPVVAKHLYLYRTAGSETGAGSGNPAEVFNLRPDAYLWATNYIANAGRLQTVSTKELPPRF